MDDGKTAQFEPALQVEKGTEVLAKIKYIKDINRNIKVYILEQVQKD